MSSQVEIEVRKARARAEMIAAEDRWVFLEASLRAGGVLILKGERRTNADNGRKNRARL